jgi:hypothetical protein
LTLITYSVTIYSAKMEENAVRFPGAHEHGNRNNLSNDPPGLVTRVHRDISLLGIFVSKSGCSHFYKQRCQNSHLKISVSANTKLARRPKVRALAGAVEGPPQVGAGAARLTGIRLTLLRALAASLNARDVSLCHVALVFVRGNALHALGQHPLSVHHHVLHAAHKAAHEVGLPQWIVRRATQSVVVK